MQDIFPTTRALIPAWQRTGAKLDKLFESIETQRDFEHWNILNLQHIRNLQDAFHSDTKSFNTLENCRIASPHWIIKTVQENKPS